MFPAVAEQMKAQTLKEAALSLRKVSAERKQPQESRDQWGSTGFTMVRMLVAENPFFANLSFRNTNILVIGVTCVSHLPFSELQCRLMSMKSCLCNTDRTSYRPPWNNTLAGRAQCWAQKHEPEALLPSALVLTDIKTSEILKHTMIVYLAYNLMLEEFFQVRQGVWL